MGVYIKGMDMSEIERLVFTDRVQRVQLVFVWTSTPSILTAKTISETKDGVKIYSREYEVVRVKEPHGRLIDADDFAKYIVRDIDYIPTVIEAEGE